MHWPSLHLQGHSDRWRRGNWGSQSADSSKPCRRQAADNHHLDAESSMPVMRTTPQQAHSPSHQAASATPAFSVSVSADATPQQTVSTQWNTTLHTFNSPFSGTTRVSQHQKHKTNLDFKEARDSKWQWHQLGHMQVCTSLQTTTPAPHHSVNTGWMPFLAPNWQRQSTGVSTQ